jgi:hypothetical protein
MELEMIIFPVIPMIIPNVTIVLYKLSEKRSCVIDKSAMNDNTPINKVIFLNFTGRIPSSILTKIINSKRIEK